MDGKESEVEKEGKGKRRKKRGVRRLLVGSDEVWGWKMRKKE